MPSPKFWAVRAHRVGWNIARIQDGGRVFSEERMKFTIAKDTFQGGLNTVRSVVPTRATLPILTNVLITAQDNTVVISATNLDTLVRVRVPAEVTEPGSVTVPARKLTELVSTLTESSVKVDSPGKQVRIQSGKASFTLHGMDPDEFPGQPSVSFDDAISLPGDRISELAAHVTFAASTEESRPILNGVLWELRPGLMRMVATNGHRLARMDAEIENGSTTEAQMIVPRKVLEDATRFFQGADAVQVAFANNHLALRADSIEVYTRLIEGPYPRYEAVIPQDNDRIALVEVAALKAALRRISVMASEQTHRVRFSFANNILTLSAETPDLGGGQDSITIKYDGLPLDIGFNASYILEILDKIKTEWVEISMKGPERAAMFIPMANENEKVANYLALCMPLRLFD